jgi:PKD repeat protein
MDEDLVSPRAGYYAFQNFDKTWPENVDFSADVTTGSAPLTVQFTDHSTYEGIQAWSWEFGDGETSSEQNPAHTYTQEGSFTVRLTVTTADDTDVVEKADYIRVTDLPPVAFIGGQIPPTSADSQIITHLESLGLVVDVYDDEPGNRPTAPQIAATHDLVIGSSTLLSANLAGEFRNESVPFIYWESALSLSDREALADGPDIDGGQTQINVIDNSHLVMAGIPSGIVTVTNNGANFSRSTGPVASGAQVLATNVTDPSRRMVIVAEPGAELLDGGVAVGKRVFLFLYDTTWLDTNDTGKQIFDNAIAWTLGLVQADFEASVLVGMVPLTVDFSDMSTGPVSAWSWDFGDSTSSSVRHPSHTYDQPGTYDVMLTASGAGQTDSITRTGYIVVRDRVQPDFDGDGDVDLTDYGHLQVCYTGPLAGPPEPGCEDADFNGDNSVDQNDFGVFQACMSGPNIPADLTCDD